MSERYDLEDCPICREGVGSVEHEGGWCVYVECLHCGAHTAHFAYNSEEERESAEKGAVQMWNLGKVIRQDLGE